MKRHIGLSARLKIAALLLVCGALTFTAAAKRIPAPVLEPIVYEGIRYVVPNDKGTLGYVVAQDVATGKQLWKTVIFRKFIWPLLEPDVQIYV